ncbi:MAG TPA: rubredoxin, partial [Firmicutes bacterium]|nr:rubredoxin [Bacillota bacterium]HBG43402.1 rubredoxin [Bacillota bacterium]
HKGIEDQLDPPCVQLFEKAAAEAHQIQQMVKAELQGHMNKGKWG